MATKKIPQPKRCTILGAIEEALGIAEELRDELQNWLDNLPENLQDGQKAGELQEAIDALEQGISSLEDAQGSDLEAAHQIEFDYMPSTEKGSSRRARLAHGVAALQCVPEDCPEGIDEQEWDDFIGQVIEARDSLDGVSFPGMR